MMDRQFPDYPMKSVLSLALVLFNSAALLCSAEPFSRSIPNSQTNHPGNVFLAGEEVVFSVPVGAPASWHLLGYDNQELSVVRVADGVVKLGRLPVGFYRLRCEGQTNWVSCAVLGRLKSPTPPTSPVALDVAMAWFYPEEKMAEVASLCAMAGVNQVRDRLLWGEMEPQPGEWSVRNRNDVSVRTQADAGLRVLQVIHLSPPWANPTTKRFPADLRHAYRFFREMARRWQGSVQAFEPWNEADITVFGGHTGSEMAAMQKASYLGLKAGNPGITACMNVFAQHELPQLADLHDNEAWPYFDTFNLHHYTPFDDYPKMYADFRAVSAGKPLWVSECALPVKWTGDEKLKEPGESDLRVQSERVAKTFASSLHEGSVATFYFMLPHYVEGQTQFGLLRPDLMPRPGYVALAAVGRLLADARPLGRMRGVSENIRCFLFQAKPDGLRRNVLVAWTSAGEASLPLPATPVAVFDHLGRDRAVTNRLALSTAPLFVICTDDLSAKIALQAPPARPEVLAGAISPVVIQALWPEESIVLSESAYRVSSQKRGVVPLFVYNFSDQAVTGRLRAVVPSGWKVNSFEKMEIAPQARAELRLELDCATGSPRPSETVRIVGDFGRAGSPVLSMRVMPEPNPLLHREGTPIIGSGEISQWRSTISGEGRCLLSADGGSVVVDAEPRGDDRWVYPLFKLAADQRPPAGASGLGCTLGLRGGEGQFRVIFDEENGSSYAVDFIPQPTTNDTVEAVARFDKGIHGEGWSKEDPNGRLDPDQVVSFKIGCNTHAATVRFAIKNLRWVK